MTLTLRDLNGSDTGLFNYRHFSKVAILNDTLRRENKIEHNSFVDYSFRQKIENLDANTGYYEGENWSEAFCRSKTRYSGRSLNLDSDSVLNFSLASAPKINNLDGNVQLFTPPVIGDSALLNLEELNAHISLLLEEFARVETGELLVLRLGVFFIPQIVRLNQALARFDNDPKGKATAKCVFKFVELTKRLLREVWLNDLADFLVIMKSAVQYLEKYRDQYTKIELKGKSDKQLGLIVRQWSMLNYFPAILVQSLNFKVLFAQSSNASQKEQDEVENNEIIKIMLVTMALEVSKSFIKLINIVIGLDECKSLEDCLVMQMMHLLLDYTVESCTGEIMIGVDQSIKAWITEKSKTDPECKSSMHHWVRGILYDYKMRLNSDTSTFTFSSDDEEQVAELMFDKCDLGKIFVEEILRFSQPERRGTPAHGNSIGWLTVFEDEGPALSNTSGEGCDPGLQHSTLVSLQPPHDIIVGDDPNCPVQVQPTKREAVKKWAHNNKIWLSQEVDKIKEKFHNIFHFHRQPTMITSVRYYNALASRQSHRVPFPGDTTTFLEGQRVQIEKLTRSMYKREKRGRRKRDALRVIVS
ncbi:uncharacterized protein ZBAI_04537 [Zygosaccharomyces bailii ISA1307]|nr:uncharacterized protein ZBAI_04537 [Zygosaccharomyces bailii ISA1307]